MTIEINGMAHVVLTVSDFAAARAFYGKLLPQFGMKPVFDGDRFFYCVGGRTAIGIEPCAAEYQGGRFVQQRVGLHHLCLRARSREDVDRCAAAVREIGATPMASVWRCASSQGPAYWNPARPLIPAMGTSGVRAPEGPEGGTPAI
jgi:catechol-2,3-dioxygenase